MFLAIAALIGFLFGVLVGYLWRDRISRARVQNIGSSRKSGARSRWIGLQFVLGAKTKRERGLEPAPLVVHSLSLLASAGGRPFWFASGEPQAVDIGIDRALKALGLHVCMAPSFGAEFGPLPEDCRDIRRGSKHLLHKRGAPQIDECKPVFAISRWKLMGIATLYIWAIPTAECQSSRTRQ
jgi:hypothetical protein